MQKLSIPVVYQVLVFFAAMVAVTLIVSYYWEFTLLYLLWVLLVFVRSVSFRQFTAKFDSGLFATILLIFTLLISGLLSHFESIKERETRKALVQQLEIPDDVTADYILKK